MEIQPLTMPRAFMLCGVPASGKSTWMEATIEQYKQIGVRFLIISSDIYIERAAKITGFSYTEVFKRAFKDAERAMNNQLHQAVARDEHIIWDQTNLTPKARMSKLAKIPGYYQKIAVYFPTPTIEEHNRRLNGRPEKPIPSDVIQSMRKCFVVPTTDEGFDLVYNGTTYKF